MMTMKMADAIANALAIGMDFDTVVSIIATFTDNVSITAPDDVIYGYIVAGDFYGYSVHITFDDDNKADEIEVSDGDWD